jgi:TP901 family phage tail tape measure protein
MAQRSSSVDVFVKLRGQRQFKRDALQAGAALETMGFKGAKAMSAFAVTGEKLKSFGRTWTRNVTLPMVGLGVVAGKMSIDFSDAMNQIQTQAGASAREVTLMRQKILDFAKSGKSDEGPLDLARALFRIESAGLRGARAMDALRQAEALSSVGRTDIELTAQALAGAVKTGIRGAQNLNQAVGVLNATVGAGNMRFEDLLGALGTGILPSAKAAGMSLTDVGAALATMTAQNVPAQAAATRLRMAFSQLIAPTDKAKTALRGLGLGPMELAQTLQREGMLPALDRLKSKLNRLSKVQQGKVISDIFGGGRTSSGITLLLGSMDDLSDRYDLITQKAGGFNDAVRSLDQEPGVKIRKAWAKVQAILIELGDKVGPSAATAIGRIADVVEKVAMGFAALPGPLQAATVGFLILTGPVASGLGYFASGIGKSLILMKGLGEATTRFNAVMSSSVMTQQSGFRGALGAAFGGAGTAGALQAAKGFALSLGAGLALYGIGDIVTSALQEDWKAAGFKAGGAIAGGIAGFALSGGNPLGAMIGMGLGSVGGGLLSKLFDTDGLTSRQRLIRSQAGMASEALRRYRKALDLIPSSQQRAQRAEQAHSRAVREANIASRAQARTLGSVGTHSYAAYRAALRVADANRQVAKTARQAQKANELQGFALKLFRRESIHLVAAEKQRIPALRQQLAAVRRRMKAEGETTPLLRRAVGIQEKLRGITDRLTKTYAEAESKAGRRWASRLQSLTAMQAKYGARGRALTDTLRAQTKQLSELERTGQRTTPMWESLRKEIDRTRRAMERFHAATTGLAPPRLQPGAPGGLRRGGQPQVPQASRRRGSHSPSAPAPKRRQPQAGTSGADFRAAFPRDDRTFTFQIPLDGRVLAESTLRVSEDDAALT